MSFEGVWFCPAMLLEGAVFFGNGIGTGGGDGVGVPWGACVCEPIHE